MGMDYRDEMAKAAMQAILQQDRFSFLFEPQDNPPRFNSYGVGKYGEHRKSAERAVAELAYRMADEMAAVNEGR